MIGFVVFFSVMITISTILFNLNINLFIFFTMIGIMSVILFVQWIIDYYIIYNKGTCRKCGSKYREFDMDSSGATGIICDNCGKSHWVHI